MLWNPVVARSPDRATPLLWHGLPTVPHLPTTVVARSPDRATPPDRRSPFPPSPRAMLLRPRPDCQFKVRDMGASKACFARLFCLSHRVGFDLLWTVAEAIGKWYSA